MGDINVQDDVTAELEALTHELNRCKKGEPHVEQLIVESDNVMLVQYVNGRPEPNEITMQRLKKISNLLKCITCAVLSCH
uniref:RNase H type-1 domain-containing protein n=1 Tax=Solanum tuberosum TaxID=4113 RepID=M1BEW6_SOLTU